MARYRRIDVRIWLDEIFQSLSRILPCGQGLWFFLLTNPDTTNIPGLYRAGEAAMAEALGWPIEAFRTAWAEIVSCGMAEADWAARVVWLPNAIHYNAPANPNVVRGWRVTWDEIPECPLKRKAAVALHQHLVHMGAPFAAAFEAVDANHSGNRT